MRLGVKAALVDGTLVEGDISVDGDRIEAIGLSPAGRSGLAVPGLIDVQIATQVPLIKIEREAAK